MDLNKSKILNISWIGQGDFGDEVMTFVIRKYLQSNGAKEICYYKKGKYPYYQDKDDLRMSSLYTYDTKKLITKMIDKVYLRKFDLLIIGGGSMLHSYNSVFWKYRVLKEIKKSKGKSTAVIIGVSVSPFGNKAEQDLCARFFNDADAIVLRDSYSYDLAKKISPNSNIISSLDLSLILPDIYPTRFLNPSQSDSEVVGLIFTKDSSSLGIFEKNKNFEKYLAIINYFLAEGKKVKLISLYTGSGYLDEELNESLRNTCSDPQKVQIHNFTGDIFTTIDELKECGYIISMRLHGVVFAYLLGIPFISLGYNQKNKNFCQTINYPQNLIFEMNEIEDLNNFFAAAQYLLFNNKKVFTHAMALNQASQTVKESLDAVFKG